MKQQVPESIADSVLKKSDSSMIDKSQVVSGYDFNKGIDYDAIFDSYKCMGFQATNMARAIDQINQMIYWNPSKDQELNGNLDDLQCPDDYKCKIFLGYTSNMISCGMREIIRFLIQHKMVDCVVTTAGGIEEDIIKCLADTYLGDFNLPGKQLRERGLNRIGNLIVPNDNYCKFEDWINPILDKMLEEQKQDPVNNVWSPSKMIARMGKEINDERSVYYWAYKNNIPVFCPAITDGSIGDMIYFHSFRNPGLVLDIVSDIKRINSMAVHAKKTGMIILGGGVVKHHICNANLMRNGADFSVFINTGVEYDGSDTGAHPDEAVSWGKIRMGSTAVKVYGEATLIFPIIVAQTFAKKYHQEKQKQQRQEKEQNNKY
jgi:deoxyhypusine synthase